MAAIAATLLSSCATHSGLLTSNTIEKDATYTGIAIGVSQSKQTVGIGGLSRDALAAEAKHLLIKNNALEPGEQFANYTIDFKNTYYPFVSTIKATVTADIVKKERDNKQYYTDQYLKKINTAILSNELFSIHDSVWYKRKSEAIIIGAINQKKVRLQFISDNGAVKTKTASINKIYSINKTYKNQTPQEYYVTTGESDNKNSVQKIMGVGLKDMLLKGSTKKLKIVRYQ